MKLQIPASILCGVISISCGAERKAEPVPTPLPTIDRPNVILFVVDDLGWNDLGCMGSTFYETPMIDSLANMGALFTNGYASANVSSPSRASILTGKAPVRHGITSWIGDVSGEEWREKGHQDRMMPASYLHSLDTTEYTIANTFADNDYATFFVGKWHLGEDVYPTDFGFDINIGGWSAGSPVGGYFTPYQNPMLPDGNKCENLTERLTGESMNRVYQHLREYEGSKPFFLMMSYYAVHAPTQTDMYSCHKYQNKAAAMGLDTEEGFDNFGGDRLPSRIAQDNPIYAGMIESVDKSITMFISFLNNFGLLNNTIIIFTSDNGGVVSGDNYSTSVRPLRGGKGTQWEGGTRVPFIVFYPGMKHKVIDEPTINMDIYPTLLDLAGIEPKPEQHMDGVSLRPLLENRELEERSLFWHFPHYGNQGGLPNSIIRDGDWKLIFYHEDNRVELYNLAEDISESNDLAPTQSERVNKMVVELNNHLREHNAKMPARDPLYDKNANKAWIEDRYTTAKTKQEVMRSVHFESLWKPNSTWWGSLDVRNKREE